MITDSKTRQLVSGMIAATLLLLTGCSDEAANTATPPATAADRQVDVGIVTLEPQSVPQSIQLPGRVVASAVAEIRPQVDGIVKELVFKEGRPVKKGDVLYRIDAAKFEAAVKAAEANVAKAEATTAGAKDTLERYQRLSGQNAVSQQELSTARTTMLQAEADLLAAKADLDTARINLSNTTIKAPISGMIGTSAVNVGALVAENQTTALATIRKTDPIYVDLVDTSANLLQVRQNLANGQLDRGDDKAPEVTLTLETGDAYGTPGRIETIDFVVSETTGTFPIRAVFENADHILLPGMFVRASVNLGTMPGAFLVPQRAVSRNAAGEATAYFVGNGETVDSRVIETDGTQDNNWIVVKGISAGDRLIVDGLQKISEGARVRTTDATIDGDGVVRQTIAETAGKTQEPAE